MVKPRKDKSIVLAIRLVLLELLMRPSVIVDARVRSRPLVTSWRIFIGGAQSTYHNNGRSSTYTFYVYVGLPKFDSAPKFQYNQTEGERRKETSKVKRRQPKAIYVYVNTYKSYVPKIRIY